MRKMRKNRRFVVFLLLMMMVFAPVAQASPSSDYHRFSSLHNPWAHASIVLQTIAMITVYRLIVSPTMQPHMGLTDGFSSPSFFTDYEFGKTSDKRPGGFSSYTKSYTAGVDAMYNDSTLLGLIYNYTEVEGRNGVGTKDRLSSNTFSVYMAKPLNDNMAWGMSFSYNDADDHLAATETDIHGAVFAPYVSIAKQVDNWTLSLTPSYVLGYQEADYSTTAPDDTALMGKLALMSRAACAVSENMTVSASLNFNQVLHNHGMDVETDPDHNWFTYGIKMDYQVTDNLSTAFGYNSEFDSDFDSDLWLLSLAYAF